MAKRKRLSPANPAAFGAAPEVKAAIAQSSVGAPSADVAADTASTAALEEVTRELSQARDTGRMILSLTLGNIALDHLVRDRVVADDAEMEALMSSIAERGQQTPIEVLERAPGQYGLSSGWRRCQAIARLVKDGRHDGTVLALLRKPADASEAYLAMVEENEIRVGLSYFERARIAAKAVEQGVFETEKGALLSLFRSASRAKRSKIRSFLPLVAAFDGALAFPGALSERFGLRFSAQLETDPSLADAVQSALSQARPETAEAELAVLTRVLTESEKKQSLKGGLETESSAPAKPVITHQAIRPQLQAEWDRDADWIKLSGADMTPALRERLFAWLKAQRG